MLTYYVYAPLLNRIDALPLNVIYNFKIALAGYKKIKNDVGFEDKGDI